MGSGSVCCGRKTGGGMCGEGGSAREMREGTVKKRNEEGGDGGGRGRGNTVLLVLK